MTGMRWRRVFSFLIASSLAACSVNEDGGPSGGKAASLLTQTELATIDTFGIKSLAGVVIRLLTSNSVDAEIDKLFPYDVRQIRVTYTTSSPGGLPTTASGLVLLPKPRMTTGQTVTWRLASYQHHTLFPQDEAQAPSHGYGSRSTKSSVYASLALLAPAMLLAAQGWMVAVPDYLGYGESKAMLHPFLHRASLAGSVVDLLAGLCSPATDDKDLRRQLSSNGCSNLALVGFSEGASATFAAVDALQKRQGSGLHATQILATAGPYDLVAFANAKLKEPDKFSILEMPAWAVATLHRWNKLSVPLTTYLKSPYDQAFKDGVTTINTLAQKSETVFTTKFFEEFKKNAGPMVDAMKSNSTINADVGDAHVHLFHGKTDPLVPKDMSELMHKDLQQRGAKVEYVPLNNAGHGEALLSFLPKAVTILAAELQKVPPLAAAAAPKPEENNEAPPQAPVTPTPVEEPAVVPPVTPTTPAVEPEPEPVTPPTQPQVAQPQTPRRPVGQATVNTPAATTPETPSASTSTCTIGGQPPSASSLGWLAVAAWACRRRRLRCPMNP